MDALEFDTLELYRRDIDDVRVLSANRQVLVLECILTNTVYTHKHTLSTSLCSHSLLGTIIILISINIRLSLFFPGFLPPFTRSISACSFSGSPAQLSPD